MNPGKLSIAATFQNEKRGTALCFHREGALCISCGGGSVRLVDCLSGSSRKVVHCKKYGINAAAYTHHELSIIHAGGEGGFQADNAIRYLSLYDNKYLRVFRGHELPVRTLTMCPSTDIFVSGADDALALWDLKDAKGAIAVMPGASRAAYSPDGLVLGALSIDGDAIRLYDSRKYDVGPFASFDISHDDVVQKSPGSDLPHRLKAATFCGLDFSPDGEKLLMRTDANVHLLYDSFDCKLLDVLWDAGDDTSDNNNIPDEPPPASLTNACFTPDGAHVVAGSTKDPLLRSWRLNATTTSSGRPHATLKGHAIPVHHLAYSPNFDVLASVCATTCIWLPSDPPNTNAAPL
ncbi:hypothetical protein CTAYLR_005517 [Chrysophaeum taylorii]|uniref:Uncharacterized protein n=1 Tax=Chrysophaeum taylorii TaxID=2483200 RepID=A0AAD7U5M6_9STRA|nr:hypothetical protein CTAYLR_005517 [Chrysophaeum taylorii]